jgi:phage shock protein C
LQRSVRAAPHATLDQIRHRFREVDGRLQRLEKYLTSQRFKLDREFEALKD